LLQAIGTGDLAWQPREVKRGELGSAVKKNGELVTQIYPDYFSGSKFHKW